MRAGARVGVGFLRDEGVVEADVDEDSPSVETNAPSLCRRALLVGGKKGEMGVGGGAEGVWETAVGVSATLSSSSSASSSQLSATGADFTFLLLGVGFDGGAEGSMVRFLRNDARSFFFAGGDAIFELL